MLDFFFESLPCSPLTPWPGWWTSSRDGEWFDQRERKEDCKGGFERWTIETEQREAEWKRQRRHDQRTLLRCSRGEMFTWVLVILLLILVQGCIYDIWSWVWFIILTHCSGRRLHGDLRDDWPKASRGEGDEEQEREHGRARDPNQLCQVLPDVGLKVWKGSSWLMSFINDNHLNISTNIYKCIIFVFSARKERTRQSPRRLVGKNGDIGASQAPKVFIFSCSQF